MRWLVSWQSKQQISPIKVAGGRAEGCNWYHCHRLIIEKIKRLLNLSSNLESLSRSQDINIPFNSRLEALRSDWNITCEWLHGVRRILWDSEHLCGPHHVTHVETHIVKLSTWLESSIKQREQRITLVCVPNDGQPTVMSKSTKEISVKSRWFLLRRSENKSRANGEVFLWFWWCHMHLLRYQQCLKQWAISQDTKACEQRPDNSDSNTSNSFHLYTDSFLSFLIQNNKEKYQCENWKLNQVTWAMKELHLCNKIDPRDN